MLNNYLTVINSIDTFCANHANIHRFKSSFFEQMDDFSTSGNSFPIFYAVPNDIAMEENIDVMSFRIYCLDILQKDRVNEEAILNSTYQNLRDLVNWFRNDEFNDLNVLNSPRAIPVNNFLVDFTTGWYVDVELEVSVVTNDCSIPFTQNFQLTGTSCDVSYITPFLTCATVTGCTTLQEYVAQQINNSLTGGTGGGFSGWTGSSGVNSIIANNGTGNIADGYTSVVGGQTNNAGGDYSSIIGGSNNIVSNSGTHALIVGGLSNLSSGNKSIIVGGRENSASTYYSIVIGGIQNLASGEKSFVGNGSLNIALNDYSTVVNGSNNLAIGNRSFISNGSSNSAITQSSSVIGGSNNLANGQASIVIGGAYNVASGDYSSVGGYRNISSGNYSVVAGGGFNKATNQYSAVGGGNNNQANGNYSFAAGGNLNTAQTNSSSVIGGQNNLANGNTSSILGGLNNIVTGNYSSIIGGQNITATQSDTAYVPFLNVQSASTDNALVNVLVRDSSGEVKLRSVSSIAPVFSGATNFYAKFTSGGSISSGMISDNGILSSLSLASSGDNINVLIKSPAGFYYPSLTFVNDGATTVGQITGYAGRLYTSPLSVGGTIDMGANNIVNMLPGVNLYDAVNVSQLFSNLGNYLNLSGGTVTGATTFTAGLIANQFYVSGYNPSIPGISNAIDTNTGIMFDGPDILSFHTGGIQALLINAGQQITNGGIPAAGSNVHFTGLTILQSASTNFLSATTLTVSTTANLYGNIFTSFSGSTNRVVEAGTTGALSATKDLIDSFLSAGTAATLLSTTSNWNASKVYTGTSITSTYQGQQYYDANYYFVCVDDNDWIRIPRI